MGPFRGWGVEEQPDGVHGPDRRLDLFAGVLAGGVLYCFGEDHPCPWVSGGSSRIELGSLGDAETTISLLPLRFATYCSPKYAFVHPLSYTVLFVVGDIVSLVVQAIGGGTASAAETLEDANRGGYVMVSPELRVLVFHRNLES
jgi:hypothetical protein